MDKNPIMMWRSTDQESWEMSHVPGYADDHTGPKVRGRRGEIFKEEDRVNEQDCSHNDPAG